MFKDEQWKAAFRTSFEIMQKYPEIGVLKPKIGPKGSRWEIAFENGEFSIKMTLDGVSASGTAKTAETAVEATISLLKASESLEGLSKGILEGFDYGFTA